MPNRLQEVLFPNGLPVLLLFDSGKLTVESKKSNDIERELVGTKKYIDDFMNNLIGRGFASYKQYVAISSELLPNWKYVGPDIPE